MTQASSAELGEWDAPVRRFHALAEQFDLHGLLFQHLELCERRAWLHLNRIDYAHLEPRMQLGIVAHEIHRPRDHSVEGLMGIAPDRVDWARREVIEAKAGAGARAAVSWQTRFYAIMLMAATGVRWSAANEIIGGRKHITVEIKLANIIEMVEMAQRLVRLRADPLPPSAPRMPICASCSYRFLCGYS